ncbi:MAG: hypothetical protein IIC90_12340 [Chloroflexi bacterium]|nr:hypothetical protein [Chloroflexota bacterium]
MSKIDSLTLVWDAQSGFLNGMWDLARKLTSVGSCTLCDITHRGVGERPEWTACKQTLGVPVEMRYRDGLSNELLRVADHRFPCVIAHVGSKPLLLLTPEAIEACRGNVETLRLFLSHHAARQGLQFDTSG